jgi:hypothetical protein
LGVGAAGTYYGAKAEAFHNALYWVQKNGVTLLTSTAESNYTFQRSFNLIEEELSTVKAVSKYAGWVGVAVSGIQFNVYPQIDPSSKFTWPSFNINPTAIKVGAIIGVGILIIVTDGAAIPLIAL